MRALILSIFALTAVASCSVQRPIEQPTTASVSDDAGRLPTGVRLDPAAASFAVGSFPLAAVTAPQKTRVALLLNGWSRTGLQIVDWRHGTVTQTIDLPAAFLGLAYSPDGQWICASGGNTDQLYFFRWYGDTAALADSIRLAPPTPRGRQSGVRYPAQLAYSLAGRRVFVAENLADRLAVIAVRSAKGG